jgi:hypothetical protein
MEHSHDCSKEADVPSLISMMVLREGCFRKPQTQEDTSKPKVLDTSALLAVLEGIDLRDMSSSQHSRFQDSGSRVNNSMVPLRKPERQLSWESLTGDEQYTPVHESSANAVFDEITPKQQSPVRRGSDLMHRVRHTSIAGDMALCKPTRKSSSENLVELPKRDSQDSR